MSYEFVVAAFHEGPIKIKLPESVLEETQDKLESPLIFRIGGTHLGVLDFSAAPGTVSLPKGIAAVHGISLGTVVQLEQARLPKGTLVSLKLNSHGESVDWERLLEAWLPANCTALTKGDMLNIRHLTSTYEIEVVNLKPESAVCIIDTVLQLEIQGLDEKHKEQKQLQLGLASNIVPGEIFQLTLSENYKQLHVLKADGHFLIGPSNATSQESFLWSLPGPSLLLLDTEWLGSSLTVIGEGSLILSDTPHPDGVSPSSSSDMGRCANCGKSIAVQSLQVHESYCSRNFVRCSVCSTLMSKSDYESHWHCEHCEAYGSSPHSFESHNILHEPGSCACGFTASKLEVSKHRATDCSLRLVECRFCRLLQPIGQPSVVDRFEGLTAHEALCGGKTVSCYICEKSIRLRQLSSHIAAHNHARLNRRAPSLCTNENCPEVVSSAEQATGISPGTPKLGLCQVCTGPFYSGGCLPDDRLLKSRIRRRYVVQLTSGCQNSWCTNQECRTGSGKSLDFGAATSRADELMSFTSQFWLCVDQLATKKLMFVRDHPEYDRGWLGLAASKCKTESSALDWLKTHAPRNDEIGNISCDIDRSEAQSLAFAHQIASTNA